MAGPVIPQLGEKLRMLVACGAYPDMEGISVALARSPNTLRWWVSGDAARAPGTVSRAALPKLLAAFAKALPDLTTDEVRRALFGPAGDVETLLATTHLPSLSALIAREADRSSGTLFVRDSALSMVRTRAAAVPASTYQVTLEQDFRIEFASRSRGRYVAAFQSDLRGWGIVPVAVHPKTRHLLLPGLDGEGEPEWMFEETETGRHTFVVLQVNRPLPAELSMASRDRLSLDRSLIAHVVRNFEAQDRSTRRLFALDVDVIKASAGAPP